MKQLLLILLCLPMIGFGQDDCGEKPKKPPRFNQSMSEFRMSKKYKAWKQEVNAWEICREGKDTTRYYKLDFPINEKTGLVTFEEVIRCDSIQEEELYSILREWFVTMFTDAEAVLQMDDIKSGKLIGKASYEINQWKISSIKFTLKIYIKEGRFKYTLTSLKAYKPYTSGGFGVYRWSNPSSETSIETYFNANSLYDKRGRLTPETFVKDEIFLLNLMISESLNNLIENYQNNNNDDDDW